MRGTKPLVAVLLYSIFIFSFFSMIHGQRSPFVTVTSATDDNPRLIRGGNAETVSLRGRNLHLISATRIVLNRRIATHVTASLLHGSQTQRNVKLLALAQATDANGYQLRLYFGRSYLDIPLETLKIDVISRPVHDPPRITFLRINNGERETRNVNITLNNRAINSPTHYRTKITTPGADPGFGGWLPYDPAPSAILRRIDKTQTVHFQVKNGFGLSNIARAEIDLVFDVERTLFAGDIVRSTVGASLTRKDPRSSCKKLYADNFVHLRVGYEVGATPEKRDLNPYGSKCEWDIFRGVRLKQGWSYVRYYNSYTEWINQRFPGNADYKVLVKPSPGDRGLAFKIRVWADAGHKACYTLERIIVKGPWNQNIWNYVGSGRLLVIFE